MTGNRRRYRSLSTRRHLVPPRIVFPCSAYPLPPSPHLFASAYTAASYPPANMTNFCSLKKKRLYFADSKTYALSFGNRKCIGRENNGIKQIFFLSLSLSFSLSLSLSLSLSQSSGEFGLVSQSGSPSAKLTFLTLTPFNLVYTGIESKAREGERRRTPEKKRSQHS